MKHHKKLGLKETTVVFLYIFFYAYKKIIYPMKLMRYHIQLEKELYVERQNFCHIPPIKQINLRKQQNKL